MGSLQVNVFDTVWSTGKPDSTGCPAVQMEIYSRQQVRHLASHIIYYNSAPFSQPAGNFTMLRPHTTRVAPHGILITDGQP